MFTLLQLEGVEDWLDEHSLGSLIMVMYQLEFRAFLAVVLSFLVVLFLGPRTIRWLVMQKVGDSPEFYNTSLNEIMKGKANTPTMGGVLICASILISLIMLTDLRNFYVVVGVVVLVWLCALGGIDDWLKLTSARRSPGAREGLYAWEKLLFQLGLGVAVGVFLALHGQPNVEATVLTLPFQRTYIPGTSGELSDHLIQLPLIVFVVLVATLLAGTSNAVNLTDGMDGLAAGSLVVAAFALMALSYVCGTRSAAHFLLVPHIPEAAEMMIIAGAMAGACLGFLWFNCLPAQVFMGDTGSLPLGGLLAYVAVVIRQELLLLVIGGIFFIDMGSVILQVGCFKLTGGKRLFRIAPIHHHFHLGGWSEQQVVMRFWLVGVMLAMVALVSIKLR